MAIHTAGGTGFLELAFNGTFGQFQCLVSFLGGLMAADTGFVIGFLEVRYLAPLFQLTLFFGRQGLIMATGGHTAHDFNPVLPGVMALITIDFKMIGMGEINCRPLRFNILH